MPMFLARLFLDRRTPYALFAAAMVGGLLFLEGPQKELPRSAGCFNQQQAVGGVRVDASGAIRRLELDGLNALARERADVAASIAPEMKRAHGMRKISLRALEAAVAKNLKTGNPISDEMKLLAGLQEIRYVFVYPEQQDIVLAGFGEGWKITARGDIVGATTGKPVMFLDDLLTALRHAEQAAQGDISCSIDPTPEGLERLRRHVATLTEIGDPQATSQGIEKVLGPQMVTVSGLASTSHFAHVMVAADYRMKRIGMNLDPSPVPGLTSYVQLLSGGGRGMSAVAPRWWLVPDFQPVLTDEAGLAFELRSKGVKCLTEDTVFTAGGVKAQAGKSSPAAQRWADMLTTKYAELAQKEPVFAELKNVMDLAVVGALIHKEELARKAGYSFPLLLNSTELPTDKLPEVKQTDSVASMLKKGTNWIISASGGVQINAWALASEKQTGPELDSLRPKLAEPAKHWWWD
ncbi:MAG: DUF1598 domain-containing protein [Planctomycetia bacterium]|nr:DUF1598 domain-containing protein [Planctomycetia bacterium]